MRSFPRTAECDAAAATGGAGGGLTCGHSGDTIQRMKRAVQLPNGSYEAMRARHAKRHDGGATEAMAAALTCDNIEVDCMPYCYGGSAVADVPEILADLAEAGWRLCRVDEPCEWCGVSVPAFEVVEDELSRKFCSEKCAGKLYDPSVQA
jgi:hypothetical protein